MHENGCILFSEQTSAPTPECRPGERIIRARMGPTDTRDPVLCSVVVLARQLAIAYHPATTPQSRTRDFSFMSTSKLQRQVNALLSTHLGQYTIRENTRPAWLGGLELDFYIEELNVGIEVQGQQHFAYTPYFHKSYADFDAQRDRDERKRFLCSRKGARLYYIEHPSEVLQLVEQLLQIELPAVAHQNYIEYQERFQDKLQRHIKATTAIPVSRKRKLVKRYVSKIQRYQRMLDTATGETTIRNLKQGRQNQVDKMAARIGKAGAREVIAEVFGSDLL